MPAWTPANLAVAPLSWHDVSNSASLSLTGAAVNFVADLQGAASRRLEGAFNSGSALPTYSATGLAGGRPGITFADNLRTLRSSTSVSANFGIGSAVGVFMAFSHDGNGGYVNSIFGVASNTASGSELASNGGVFHWPDSEIGYRGNRDASIDYRVYAAPDIAHNFSIVGSPTDTTFYIDGGPPAPTTWGSGPTWVGHKIGIGADPHSLEGGMPGFTFGELVILGYTPSTDDRQRIEGYMAWKWGSVASLPSGHPYKSAAPQTGGGGTNYPQTVSVTATGSVSVRKAAGKRVSLAGAGAVTLRKSIGKRVSLVAAGIASIRKAIARRVSIAAASAVTVNAVATIAQVFYQTVTIAALSAISVRKVIGKRVNMSGLGSVLIGAIVDGPLILLQTINVAAAGAVSVRRALGKRVSVAAAGAVRVVKAMTWRVNVSATGSVTVIAGRLYRQLVSVLSTSSVLVTSADVVFELGRRVIALAAMIRSVVSPRPDQSASGSMESRTVTVLSENRSVIAEED